MTDLERIGQRLVTGFPGTALTPELVQVVKEYKIGNIILFRENIASADQLRTLCADLQTLIRSETGHDAFIMIDQEGGAVTRLPESCINVPGSMALAATGDPETTYLAGKLTGEELQLWRYPRHRGQVCRRYDPRPAGWRRALPGQTFPRPRRYFAGQPPHPALCRQAPR